MKNNNLPEQSGEKLLNKVRKLCKKEGMEGWKLAQDTMLKEKTEVKALQEMIEHIMLTYSPDYFRPALLSYCCKAVGGNPQNTPTIGAILTLFGWAIGIHDDIIDNSKMKSDKLTVFGKFGRDRALILSDVLLFKAFTLLRKALKCSVSPKKISKILKTIEEIWFEQSIGETLEIQSQGSVNQTLPECLEKISMRASEMEAITRIGGILGDGSKQQITNLGAYGRLVGQMSILRNEIIDMLEVGALKHRIQHESFPLPIIYTLQDPKIKPQAISLIRKSKLTEDDLQSLLQISDESGGIKYVAALIEQMNRKAQNYSYKFKIKELSLVAASLRIQPMEWKPLLSN